MKKSGLAKTKREYYDLCEQDEETGNLVMKTKYRTVKGEVEPEFISMSTSPGIGYNYFMQNIEKIKKNNGILVNVKGNVKLKNIPRYFRKLWEKKDWLDYERWKLKNKYRVEKQKQEKIKSFNLPQEWKDYQKENFVRIKMLDNQKHKFGLLRRDKQLYEEDDKNI